VMAGRHMLDFVPLNKGVDVRSPELISWLMACLSDLELMALSPSGWFHQGHQDGNFIWSPPPAAAEAALDQLVESRHVRPWNTHIFVCPMLMTSTWRKRLGKAADVMFTVPVGSVLWKGNQHEPVTVALIFPLLSRSPWQVRRSVIVDEFQRSMSGVWDTDLRRQRGGLRKLWAQASEIGFMQRGVAC